MGRVLEFDRRQSMTPRQRAALLTELHVLADEAYDDVVRFGDRPVAAADFWMFFDRFPTCTFRQPESWRREVARSADDLAGDLEKGDLPRPRTLAEQLVLAIGLNVAAALLVDEEVLDDVLALPARPGDHDWTAVYEMLFDDRDAEAFYSADEVELWLKIAPMNSWFNAVDGHESREAGRGFRR